MFYISKFVVQCRAQYNGHSSLVNFLCEHGSADDMLNIEEDHTPVSKPVTDIYSKPNKQKPMVSTKW